MSGYVPKHLGVGSVEAPQSAPDGFDSCSKESVSISFRRLLSLMVSSWIYRFIMIAFIICFTMIAVLYPRPYLGTIVVRFDNAPAAFANAMETSLKTNSPGYVAKVTYDRLSKTTTLQVEASTEDEVQIDLSSIKERALQVLSEEAFAQHKYSFDETDVSRQSGLNPVVYAGVGFLGGFSFCAILISFRQEMRLSS